MTSDGSQELPLADDEFLVYVGEEHVEEAEADQDAFEQHALRPRKSPVDRGLAKVKISDEELDQLRNRVQRIANVLEPDNDSKTTDNRFAVEEVTLHIGLSASGQFFFIASAGVEAALDITWRRSDNDSN